MMHSSEKICPNCNSPKMKEWSELTDDETLFAKSLPMSAVFKLATRKKHRFCTRCLFEDTGETQPVNA